MCRMCRQVENIKMKNKKSKSNPLYDSEKYYEQREKFEKTLLSRLSLSKR